MKIELEDELKYEEAKGLNPYSNGMKIELVDLQKALVNAACLNPYSNGMKIELRVRPESVLIIKQS